MKGLDMDLPLPMRFTQEEMDDRDRARDSVVQKWRKEGKKIDDVAMTLHAWDKGNYDPGTWEGALAVVFEADFADALDRLNTAEGKVLRIPKK